MQFFAEDGCNNPSILISYISNAGKYTSDDLVTFLNDYSVRNTHIKKPQFHVAFSCKGHEMTYEELVRFARRYMNEMGYGQPG